MKIHQERRFFLRKVFHESYVKFENVKKKQKTKVTKQHFQQPVYRKPYVRVTEILNHPVKRRSYYPYSPKSGTYV